MEILILRALALLPERIGHVAVGVGIRRVESDGLLFQIAELQRNPTEKVQRLGVLRR